MCRQCPVPGCLVLMVGADPLCSKCWARVPEAVRKEMAAAASRKARAMTTTGRDISEIEYMAAFDMAVSFASGDRAQPATNKTSADPLALITR